MDATQTHGSGQQSIGVFQQTLPWWTNDRLDVKEATKAFLRQFRQVTGSPIEDCHLVQGWLIDVVLGFWKSPETINYVEHKVRLDKMNLPIRKF